MALGGSAAAPGVLPPPHVPDQDQHHHHRDADDPEILHPALVVAEQVGQEDEDGDPGADAPLLARLAVPAPVLGALVLDGVVTDADDALFTTGLVDPLGLAHALLLDGTRRPARPAGSRARSFWQAPAPDTGRGGVPTARWRPREGCDP